MADVDGVLEIKMFDDCRCVRGVMIHVVAFADLARASMATPVVGNDPVALAEKIKQLGAPVVRAQRPTMMEEKRLRILWPPILKEDLRSVLCSDGTHGSLLCH